MKKTRLKTEIVDALTLKDLCQFCHADEAWIVELVEYGVLDPDGFNTETWRFHGVNIVRAKKACRLNRDLEVNAAGLALILDLLEERDAVVRQLARCELS